MLRKSDNIFLFKKIQHDCNGKKNILLITVYIALAYSQCTERNEITVAGLEIQPDRYTIGTAENIQ
jgi:hypothetical protein